MKPFGLVRYAAILAAFAGVSAVQAADLTLNAVLYPENEKTGVTFLTTNRAPKAVLKGAVKIEQNQSWILLDWRKLEPALLFGGDVNCWVMWAITPDGTAVNLGELPVRTNRSGSISFTSSLKQFALMVTAEPLVVVRKPSDLVAFVSEPTTSKKAKNSAFTFGAFRAGTQRSVESIAGLEYTDPMPVELQQATKAIAIMERFDAEKHAQAAARDARVALGQAEDAFEGRVGRKADVPELSRRAITLASEAVSTAVRQLEAQKLQEKENSRLAELAQKQAETEAERSARLKTEADLAEVRTQREALKVEIARVQADREQIRRERDALAQRLSGALGKVSATERTGRGLVLSLSGGILFETGKSDLRPDAKVALAKLSGILMMIPTTNIQIEGHTDSTGSEPVNAKLSEDRAAAVMDFLEMQGVDRSRLAATGIGSARPVASNDTNDGRAKNRRVEIVIPEMEAENVVPR